MDKIQIIKQCKALDCIREKLPLTEQEYKHLLELIPECPLEGRPFNERSQVYPLGIPQTPIIRKFSDEPYTISVLLKWNSRDLVSLIGNKELEIAVNSNPYGIIFAVGSIYKRMKNNQTYFNLRPRGWLLVLDKIAAEEQKRIKKQKSTKKR